SRSDTKSPGEIGLLADIFARHGRDESDNAQRLSGERREQMFLVVERWADALLSSADCTRSQLANVARAMERLPDSKLVATLQRLLAEDLARWKRSRKEFLAAHRAGQRIDTDAHMSWTLQYRRAFAAIGGPEVERLMCGYLRDAGFCGFGV